MAGLPLIETRFSGQLAVVLSGEAGLPQTGIAMGLAQACAKRGESVLLLDCDDGRAASALGLSIQASLKDVIEGRAQISDSTHITPCRRFSVGCAGQAHFDEVLGVIAAMSLSYDRVIVIAPPGCTPSHIRLTAASDHSVLIIDAKGDRFMRGFWMMDAIRARAPKCDPQIAVIGEAEESQDAYALLAETVRDYLGAPPPLGVICAHKDDNESETHYSEANYNETHYKAAGQTLAAILSPSGIAAPQPSAQIG